MDASHITTRRTTLRLWNLNLSDDEDDQEEKDEGRGELKSVDPTNSHLHVDLKKNEIIEDPNKGNSDDSDPEDKSGF